MVGVKIAFIALVACLCGISAQTIRRNRPGCPLPTRVVPRITPVPCRPGCNPSNYERTLQELVLKLVNALIYTTLQKGGGTPPTGGNLPAGGKPPGGTGGGASGGSALLDLEADLGGRNLLDAEVLPTGGGAGGAGGAGGSGGIDPQLIDNLLNILVQLGGSTVADVGVL